MRQSDLAFADTLRGVVGWNQTESDWRRLLRYEPEGCFVAEKNGQPAGTATTTRFGSGLAWIGMVLVQPEQRGQGIGTALMSHCLEYLERKGATCVKLDATPQGQPIYEQLGFQPEWCLQRWAALPLPPNARNNKTQCRRWDAYATVAPLDMEAFGVDRRLFLEALRKDSSLALIHPDSAEFDGFGLVRAGARASYIGPVIARTDLLARELIRGLTHFVEGNAVYWDIPDHQTSTVELARRLGFVPQRKLIRMFRGTHSVPGQPKLIYAITGPETG